MLQNSLACPGCVAPAPSYSYRSLACMTLSNTATGLCALYMTYPGRADESGIASPWRWRFKSHGLIHRFVLSYAIASPHNKSSCAHTTEPVETAHTLFTIIRSRVKIRSVPGPTHRYHVAIVFRKGPVLPPHAIMGRLRERRLHQPNHIHTRPSPQPRPPLNAQQTTPSRSPTGNQHSHRHNPDRQFQHL